MTTEPVTTTVQLAITPSPKMKRPFSVMLSVLAAEKLTGNEQERIGMVCRSWIEAKFTDWVLRPRPTAETIKLFNRELNQKIGEAVIGASFGTITVRGYFLSESAIADLLGEYWAKAA